MRSLKKSIIKKENENIQELENTLINMQTLESQQKLCTITAHVMSTMRAYILIWLLEPSNSYTHGVNKFNLEGKLAFQLLLVSRVSTIYVS